MSKYTFELDDANAVRIFFEGQEAPLMFQPTWPDGTEWANADEASEWAETFIKSMTDPDYGFVVGNSPEEPKLPKPEPVSPESLIAE